MTPVKSRVSAEVRDIIAKSTIKGNLLLLPMQLDRDVYVRVNKALTLAHGKWDRRAGGHVFPFDPRTLLGEVVEAGTIIDTRKTLQFFQTPEQLAERMVKLSALRPGMTALEPSAGWGRLVKPMLAAGALVDAVELDLTNATVLSQIDGPVHVQLGDFLDWHVDNHDVRFDAVVMNPPFRGGQDIAHILAAWFHLKPGGRLVAICGEGAFFREDRAAANFRAWLHAIPGWYAGVLDAGTFRSEGTDVAARLIVVTFPLEIDTAPTHSDVAVPTECRYKNDAAGDGAGGSEGPHEMTDINQFSAMQLVQIYNVATDGKEVAKFESTPRGRERLLTELKRLGATFDDAVLNAVNAGVIDVAVARAPAAALDASHRPGADGFTSMEKFLGIVDGMTAEHSTRVTNLANGESLPRPQLHGAIRTVEGDPAKAARRVAKQAVEALRATAVPVVRETPPAAAAAPASTKFARTNKTVPQMLALLLRPEGATLAELTIASQWTLPVELRNLRLMEKAQGFTLDHDGAAGDARRYYART